MRGRIKNYTVMEIMDIDPPDRFNPFLIWVVCPVETAQGLIYADGKFLPIPDVD